MTCLDTPFFQIQPQENADLAAAQAFDTQVTYTWPHVHWIENLMTISATLALPGGTAFYLYGNEVRWLASCKVGGNDNYVHPLTGGNRAVLKLDVLFIEKNSFRIDIYMINNLRVTDWMMFNSESSHVFRCFNSLLISPNRFDTARCSTLPFASSRE